MNTERLLAKHGELWRQSSEHRFIGEIAEGTLSEDAFDTWLVQDHVFVTGALGYQARLIPRAPRRDHRVMIGGLVSLEEELTWFEEVARSRSLQLGDTPHPSNTTYLRFLSSLEGESYVVNVVALWAVEQAYLDAWSNASPGAGSYGDFVEHWTDPRFVEYIATLRQAADTALSRSDERHAHRAEDAFITVARLERDFWDIAYSRVGV